MKALSMALLPALASGLILASTGACGATEAATDAAPSVVASRWIPKPGTTWQWQLSGKVDASVRAQVFDIDGEESSRALVKKLHAKGARVICYLSAGSWEDWRTDAGAFPDTVKGNGLDGWPGERWLDIRRTDVLLPIMEKRIARCRAKGFDAVEPDNVDGYTNSTGFPLTASDQLTYNKAVAKLVHRYGMAVGLKNDPEQVRALVRHFDFAVVEECVAFDECAAWTPFTKSGRAVFHAEYRGSMRTICAATKRLGFSTIKKKPNLGAYRRTC
jgi:hypothetical protein